LNIFYQNNVIVAHQVTSLQQQDHNQASKTGVENLWLAGQMRPAWTFDTANFRIFFSNVRGQHRVKTKLHDKQVLRY